jgi:hypothetical protein
VTLDLQAGRGAENDRLQERQPLTAGWRFSNEARRWLAAVCRWPTDPDYPRFRFLTFTWTPVRGTKLFMHFYCEPGEPVSREVSSRYIHEPTLRWLWPDRAERIAAFGFQISGQTENFETSVDIQSKKDLTRTARAVVDLLYAALDYRGQQSLTVELQAAHGAQTPRLPVFESVTPTRIIEVMSEPGHRLVDIEGDWDSPVLVVLGHNAPSPSDTHAQPRWHLRSKA